MKKVNKLGNMKKKAMEKHTMQRLYSSQNKAQSSVCLPNWNAARVNMAHKILKRKNISLSKTQILLACAKAYLPKLRINDRKDVRLRTRQKNENRYSYKKISTYCSFNTWDHLFQECLHNKISISHVLDIAVRLYLRVVLQQLLIAGSKQAAKRSTELLNLGKYQKIILNEEPKELKLLYFIKKPPERRLFNGLLKS